MSEPKTPDAFDAICSDVVALLTHGTYTCEAIVNRRCPGHEEGSNDCRGQRVPLCARCTYRWAHNAAFERTKLDAHRGPAGSVSNPTASIATEIRPDERRADNERTGPKAALRKALANAGSDIQLLQGIVKRLDAALVRSDTGHDAPTKFPEDTKAHRAKVQEGDDSSVAALHAAKRRREDRGEGWGIG